MPRANEEALSRPFRNSRFRPEAKVRRCDHPDCRGEGLYRAPRDRNRLTEYYWFCLEHVRAYNRAWNYYAGMNETQIEAERRRDSTWQRPSWPFGSAGYTARRFRDDFGFFYEETAEDQARRRQWEQARQGQGADEESGNGGHHGALHKALAELGLEAPVGFAAIKGRYKELVKRLHPDANGGDRTHEDRLKMVNQAYATLRAAYK